MNKQDNNVTVSDVIGTREKTLNPNDYYVNFSKYDQDEGIILATVIRKVSVKQRPGAFYNIRIKYSPIGALTTNSIVWLGCNCPDFITRWTYVLGKHNALFVAPYETNLTNEFTYAIEHAPKVTNPMNQLGACKHIRLVLLEALKIT